MSLFERSGDAIPTQIRHIESSLVTRLISLTDEFGQRPIVHLPG